MPSTAGAHLHSLHVCAAVLALMTSCNRRTRAPEGADPAERGPLVYATTYPMEYFAGRIGGGSVSVRCPVPTDHEAFLREISAEIIREYQRADLIVTNGAGYDRWVEIACLPEAAMITGHTLVVDGGYCISG